jgi:hypothetical protein
MNTTQNPLFRSTGTITREELKNLNGPLLIGEVVIKFAEHKNFAAAREEFNTWNQYDIIETDNLISQNNRLSPQTHNSWEEYIAFTFLNGLIREYEEARLEKIRVRMEDPVEQQKAAELLKIRQSGKLPHIDLAGIDFTVDWRLRQMRDTEQPWNNISFDDFEMDDYGDKYLCFFNTQTHELYTPPEDIIELPEHVVVLEIPNELDLDPVAVAREYGADISELLREYPITEKLTAKVSPLSDTGLPAIIESNIRAQQNSTNEKQDRRGR